MAACAAPDGRADTPQLTVFAAASLQEVVRDAAQAWTERSATPVTFSFAGSNTLAQQILAAPGADVFLSADDRWMDQVQDAGRLRDAGRIHIWRNSLVVVGRHDAQIHLKSTADLASATYRHLALGDPQAVPAGRYAKEVLEHTGIWSKLASRVVPSADVRAALALVESDPEIVGIVYRTDVATSTKARILLELPPVDGLDIVYAAAPVRDGAPEAESFLDFLASADGLAIAARHGFQPATPHD